MNKNQKWVTENFEALVSEYGGKYVGEILLESNGKLHLAASMNPDNLQFSEADSDNMAALAFARSSRVGVDIERVREFPDMLELVEHQFTERENRAVLSCAEDQRLALFYRLWTRKEAVLKAQGEGLLKGLDSVDVAGDEGPGPWRASFSDKDIPQGTRITRKTQTAKSNCPQN